MVFGADDAHIQFLLVVQLVQQHFRGGTGSHNDRFAFQVCEVFNLAAFFGQQTRTDHEDGVGEGRLFLTFEVVSGGATLKIEGAVLQQGNTVLRRNWNQLHLQIRFVELLLDRFYDRVGVVLRVAYDFLRVVVV
ncbi:hypothetical protein D3C72_1344980 [compost metagenome]